MDVVGEEKDTKHTTCFGAVASHDLAQLGLPLLSGVIPWYLHSLSVVTSL